MPQKNSHNKRANEDIHSGKKAKKYWKVRTKEGQEVEFFPYFEANEDGEVECQYVEIRVRDRKGNMYTYTFNYLDMYMFMYFTANEELRQNLQARYEKQTNYIPYDVQINLSPDEQRSGIARRRIELPVDELVMAIARNEAWKMWIKSRAKDNPAQFLFKNKKRKK